ncbi:MAG TPA: hypothetical protein PKB13_09220 [Clostridia bacterium]|jgi:hypothetical protein|nr:hypothetical protein [Clostridia bacterium]
MELFWTVLVLGLLTEAVVETLKLIWDEQKRKLSWSALCSLAVGIAVALSAHVSVFELLDIVHAAPQWIGCLITGILISRGSSFLHDLWKRINSYAAEK